MCFPFSPEAWSRSRRLCVVASDAIIALSSTLRPPRRESANTSSSLDEGMNPTYIKTHLGGQLGCTTLSISKNDSVLHALHLLRVTPSSCNRKLLHPSPVLPSSEPPKNHRICRAACLITLIIRMVYAYKVGK